MSRSSKPPDLVGVIPAAGRATRVSALPFSKCLYPLPIQRQTTTFVETPLGRLLDSLQQAGIDRALIVSRSGCSDVAEYVAGRSLTNGPPVAHVATTPTASVPHTICRAVPFLYGSDVILGYPDIVFEPLTVPAMLVARKAKRRADIMLALVPTDRPDKSDTVELDEENRVVQISVKTNSGRREAWILAVWNSRFTEFLVDYVGAHDPDNDSNVHELQVSEIFVAAQGAGLSLLAERFSSARFLDLGTPDALTAASHFLSSDRDV